MLLRDLMLVLGSFARKDAVLGAAIDIAQQFGAHLSGLCPIDLLIPANANLELGWYPAIVALPEAVWQLETEAQETAAGIEANFREQLRRQDVRGDWQLVTGESAQEVAYRARNADLLVLGQPDPARSSAAIVHRLLESVLLTAGRPLLLIPFAGKVETIGTNVLLGWNGSREATRAVHDALPLIEPEARLTVLTIVPRSAAMSSEISGA